MTIAGVLAGKRYASRPRGGGFHPTVPEGFGSAVTGGDGGTVMTVDTLADSGSGSLREALTATGTRRIVFALPGTIELQSTILVSDPDFTVDGSTAPGEGVMVRGRDDWDGALIEVAPTADNALFRYLRLRRGSTNIAGGTSSADCMWIDGADGVLVDHCSLSWSIDGLLDMTAASNVTVQWCMLSEPLHKNNHEKGWHGYGPLLAAGGQRITLAHNLFAFCAFRPDSVSTEVEFINNLFVGRVFHQMALRNDGVSDSLYNVISNRFQSTSERDGARKTFVFELQGDDTVYVEGNLCDIFRPSLASGDDWDMVGDEINTSSTQDIAMRKTDGPHVWSPAQGTPVTSYSADILEGLLLPNVGALLPCRDIVDRRVVDEVKAIFGGDPSGGLIKNTVDGEVVAKGVDSGDEDPATTPTAGGWPTYGWLP